MSKEIWKPVPSKPGVMASNFGRIKLPESTAKMPHGGTRIYKTKPTFGVRTKASKTTNRTYMGVMSKKFGNMKIHRLVCEAFHGPEPDGKPYVLHLDEDATNNRADNLKWGTQKENMNMPKYIAYCKSRTGKNNPYLKGINSKKST